MGMMVAVDQSGRDQPSLQMDRLALRRRNARRPDVANKMAVDDNIDWSVARPGIFPYQCQASNQSLPHVSAQFSQSERDRIVQRPRRGGIHPMRVERIHLVV